MMPLPHYAAYKLERNSKVHSLMDFQTDLFNLIRKKQLCINKKKTGCTFYIISKATHKVNFMAEFQLETPES